MAAYCQVYGVIHFVTCGLTACTPGSAPGPTLGNEYGKTLPYLQAVDTFTRTQMYLFNLFISAIRFSSVDLL